MWVGLLIFYVANVANVTNVANVANVANEKSPFKGDLEGRGELEGVSLSV